MCLYICLYLHLADYVNMCLLCGWWWPQPPGSHTKGNGGILESFSLVPCLGNLVWRMFLLTFCLSSGCCNKRLSTGWLRPHTFIFHISGGWEVQDRGASRFSVWWGPSSWFANGRLPAVSSHGRERGKAGTLFSFLIRALILSWELFPDDFI